MRPCRGRARRGRQSTTSASRAFVIVFRFDKQAFCFVVVVEVHFSSRIALLGKADDTPFREIKKAARK